MKKEEEINIIIQIKKLLKLEMADTRAEEGRITRRNLLKGGLVAALLAAATTIGGVLLPSKAVEEGCVKLPSGEIVYFQKPIDTVKSYFGGEHNIFRIKTTKGEKYFSFWDDREFLKYDPKTEEIATYASPEKIMRKFKDVKLYNTKEELKKEFERPRRGGIPHLNR